MKILSLNGGGVRGILSARVGERLCESSPEFHKDADVIAGTSTGGLIALGLSAGMSWRELVSFYYDKCPEIFKDSWLDNLADINVGGVSLRGAQYDNEPLRYELTRVFGDMTLGDLYQDVLIPAFDFTNWRAKFFSKKHDPHEPVVEVAMATSAAPLVFPLWKNRWVDGGAVANDPAVSALAYVLNPKNGYTTDAIMQMTVDPPCMLALGTGDLNKQPRPARADRGLLDWARDLADVFFEGGLMAPVYQVTQFMGPRYLFVNPRLEAYIPMDGGGWRGREQVRQSLDLLLEYADAHDLSLAETWLQTIWGQPQVEQ